MTAMLQKLVPTIVQVDAYDFIDEVTEQNFISYDQIWIDTSNQPRPVLIQYIGNLPDKSCLVIITDGSSQEMQWFAHLGVKQIISKPCTSKSILDTIKKFSC